MISFKTYFNKNLQLNFSITVGDINRYERIHGEPTHILQGKTRRNKPTVHSKIDKTPLTIPTSERHKNLHLYMDIFYVNGLILLHTKKGKNDFISVNHWHQD